MNTEHKIIEYLGRNPAKSNTMHELSKLLEIPYASFYRKIQNMKDLLVVKTIGKSKIITLNYTNPILKSHLAVSSDETRKEFLKKQRIITKISTELNTKDIVVLFGSYAKEKQHEKSDIDILVVNKDGKRSISFSKYELLYKKTINSIFITEKEFKKMIGDKEENVGKQALNNHIVLNNPERFWECVLHAI